MQWTKADGNLAIYFNGELNSRTFSNITSVQNTAVPLRIGQFLDGAENSFRGSLDDLRIYNRPLSEQEIKKLYTTEVITSSADVEGQMNIDVYPNPVQSELYIKLPGFSGHADFSLIDICGQTVLRGKLTHESGSIDMSTLKPGIYSLQVIYNSELVTQKIVKEK
jgi:hypothetical protein